jgi:regulatory protein
VSRDFRSSRAAGRSGPGAPEGAALRRGGDEAPAGIVDAIGAAARASEPTARERAGQRCEERDSAGTCGRERRGGARTSWAHPEVAAEAAPPRLPDDPPADPESVARMIALGLLARQARSRAELEEALRRRGAPDEAARAVLDRLSEVGLVDDEALAERFVETRHRDRGLAPRALVRDLRRRGIEPALARQAVAGLDRETERERAGALVRARLAAGRAVVEPARTRRLVAFLCRKGYDAPLAFDVVARETREFDEAIRRDGPPGCGA